MRGMAPLGSNSCLDIAQGAENENENEDNEDMDEETNALNKYNKKMLASDRVETILLPIRDGLMVSRKIK